MNIPKEVIEKAIEGPRRDFMRKPQEWIPSHYKEFAGSSYAWIESKGTLHTVRVDDANVHLVSKYRWYLQNGYAVTSIKYKRTKLHHILLGKMEKGEVTDHINRDRLDNRSNNLRIVSQSDNAKNRPGAGIRKHGSGWEASICHNYKQTYLGIFPTQKQAAEAYSRAKRAQLNTI